MVISILIRKKGVVTVHISTEARRGLRLCLPHIILAIIRSSTSMQCHQKQHACHFSSEIAISVQVPKHMHRGSALPPCPCTLIPDLCTHIAL